jgi:small-conductance mechanosensitive channel
VFGLPRRGQQPPYGVWLAGAAWTAGAALGAALVANVVGAVGLAVLLDQSIVASLFLALGLSATAEVLEGLIVAGLRPWRRYPLRALGTHLPQIRSWLVRVVRFAAAAVWVVGTLFLFGAERQVGVVLQRVLDASLTVGSLHLSVQGLVVFVVSVWLAVVAAGSVRALLEEDVLTRMALPRGVPSAISAAANYTILFVGILLAMSAAGVSLERVTLLAGAIGVGIGFGLQNVVNNFVSGLILLVERPMRIGDVVEIGTTVGTVRRIGIRSSTLRTFEGAEVIVPNGSLIAERLTNWTFSDYARRIEVRVAVADGADPETVRTLLEQAARREDVLPNPPPAALLVAVGEGKLTFVLRAWSPTYEQAPEVQSRLTAAAFAALRTANVYVR